jgi:hypothetical protein
MRRKFRKRGAEIPVLACDFPDDYDAAGVASDARAARLLAELAIRTEGPRWTVDHVRLRLREAARGCERLVGRVGPSGAKGFWPQTMLEFSDLVEMAGSGTLKEFQDQRNAGAGGARDISDLEEAIQWPIRYLAAPAHDAARAALHCWLECEARNWTFGEHYARLGCSRRTAYNRRDVAFAAILEGVVRDGVLP